MKTTLEGKRILLIDNQLSWREAAGNVLAKRKFLVKTLDAHSYSEPKCYVHGGAPDVVILGCAKVKSHERRLINKILSHKRHLLILCGALPSEETRQLFLSGADDVTEKPYSPSSLLQIVGEAFAGRETHDSFRERMLKK